MLSQNNAFDGLTSAWDMAEYRVSELEEMLIKTSKMEMERKKKKRNEIKEREREKTGNSKSVGQL